MRALREPPEYRRSACGTASPWLLRKPGRHCEATRARKRPRAEPQAGRNPSEHPARTQDPQRAARPTNEYLLNAQVLQICAERLAKIVPAQGELDRRFQESELVSRVVPCAFEFQSINRPVAQHVLQRVGELDFAAAPRLNRLHAVEDLRRENVAADDSEIGWSVRR